MRLSTLLQSCRRSHLHEVAVLPAIIAAVVSTTLALPSTAVARGVGAVGVAGVGKVKVLGWGFNDPAGIASVGQDVFVADAGDNSVIELALPSLTPVRTIKGPEYDFSSPHALAIYGSYLWVMGENTGQSGSSSASAILTQVNLKTGKMVRVVQGLSYAMYGALGMSLVGSDLFIADTAMNEVTEIDATSGALVRLLNNANYAFASPVAITSIGPDVFVANDASGIGGTVTELDSTTGALVQVIGGPQYRFNQPSLLTSYGDDLFVFSTPAAHKGAHGSVTEIATNAPSGPSETTTTTSALTTTSSVTTTALTGTATSTTTSATSTTTTSTTTTGAQGTTTTSGGQGTTTTTTTTAPGPTADIVRVISGSAYGLGEVLGAAVIGNDLYLANADVSTLGGESGPGIAILDGPGSLLEIDLQSGALVQAYPAGTCHIDVPYGIATAGNRVLVSNVLGGSLSELSATSGDCTGYLSGSRYDFGSPAAMAVGGGHLFVAGQTFASLQSNLTLLLLGSSPSDELTEMNPSTGALTRVLRGPDYRSGPFGALAASTKYIFIANTARATVTEVDAATSSVVRVVRLRAAGPVAPTDLAVSGDYLLVAGITRSGTGAAGVVCVVDAATGRVAQIIAGKQYKFGVPLSMVVVGPDLFVDSTEGSSSMLTEVEIANGQLVRTISGKRAGAPRAIDMVADGRYLFVVGMGLPGFHGGNVTAGLATVSQIDIQTGALVRVIAGARYDLRGASAVALLRGNLYIADTGADAVTEISPLNGALVRVLRGPQYGFASPDGEATWGDHLYVANGQGHSVTDMQVSS